MGKPKAPKKLSSDKTDYSVSLLLDGKEYKASALTIFEALGKLKPVSKKGVGIVLVTYKGKLSKIPIKINPTNLSRLFAKPVDRAMFAKRLSILL